MNIYERLTEDHNAHRTLLDKLANTEGDSAERANLFEDLKRDVTAHANAEEQCFYAVLMEKPDGQEKARHSVYEHEQMDDLFEELAEKDMSSPGWLVTFKKLKHDLEHHMQEEEKDVFSRARKVIDDNKANALADKFDARKSDEKKAA